MKPLILSSLLASISFAQIGPPTQAQAIINQRGTLANIPVSCQLGQLYFATDQAAGKNLYGCTTPGNPGVWSLQSGGGSGAPFFLSTSTVFYFAPANLTMCYYNGDAGTACTPSDSTTLANNSKATPWITLDATAYQPIKHAFLVSGAQPVNQFADTALCALNGGINAAVTTITATTSGCVPNGSSIQLDGEIMLVGTVSGTSIPVTRAQSTTIAAAHLTGAGITRLATGYVYQTANELFWTTAQGAEPYSIFEVGSVPYTDIYPSSLLHFQGNVVLPANVIHTGGSTPISGVPTVAVAIRGTRTNIAVHGMVFDFYGTTTANEGGAVVGSGYSNIFFDNVGCLGDGGVDAVVAKAVYYSMLYEGPNVTNWDCASSFVDLSSFVSRSPAGTMTETFTTSVANASGTGLKNLKLHFANEFSHSLAWGPYQSTVIGAGHNVLFGSQSGSSTNIVPNANYGGNAVLTFTGATNTIFATADQLGYHFGGCGGAITCVQSGGNILQNANANTDGEIYYGTALTATNADNTSPGGAVCSNPFSTQAGCVFSRWTFNSAGLSGGPVSPGSGFGAWGYDSAIASWAMKHGNGTEIIPLTTASTGLSANAIPKATGTNGAVVASSLTDNGTTVATTEAIATTSSVSAGSSPPACTAGTAGALCANEGTSFSNVAGAAGLYPDSTAHEFLAKTNGASGAGVLIRSQPSPISLTAQVANISTATLCAAAAGACNVAGMYRATFYLASTVSCVTPGSAAIGVAITFTDDVGTKSAQVVPLDVTGATSLVGTLALGNTTGNATGSTAFWSTGANPIQYATTGYATGCTSGTATYSIRASVERIF